MAKDFDFGDKKKHIIITDDESSPFIPYEMRRFLKGVAAFVAGLILFCIIGIFFAGLQTPLYRAHGYINLGPHFQVDGFTSITGILRDPQEITRAIDDEIHVLKSERLLRKVIDSDSLTSEPEFIQLVENGNKPKSLLLSPIREFFYPNKIAYTQISDQMSFILSVTRPRLEINSLPDKPHILRVTFISADRGRAARLVKATLDSYIEMQRFVPRLMQVKYQPSNVVREDVMRTLFSQRMDTYKDRASRINASFSELHNDVVKTISDTIAELDTHLNELQNNVVVQNKTPLPKPFESSEKRDTQLWQDLQSSTRDILSVPVADLPYESLKWLKNEYIELTRLEQMSAIELEDRMIDLKKIRSERDALLLALNDIDEKMRQLSSVKATLTRSQIESVRSQNTDSVDVALVKIKSDLMFAKLKRDEFLAQPVLNFSQYLALAAKVVLFEGGSNASKEAGIIKQNINASLKATKLTQNNQANLVSNRPVDPERKRLLPIFEASQIVPLSLKIGDIVVENKPIGKNNLYTLYFFGILGLFFGYLAAAFTMREEPSQDSSAPVLVST